MNSREPEPTSTKPAPQNGAVQAAASPPSRRYRLAAIFPRPHIYFCQFMQSLAARPEIDLTVYFYTSFGMGSTPEPFLGRALHDAERSTAGYQARFLKNYSLRPGEGPFMSWFHPGVIRELCRDYDAVIVHGWWSASNIMAYLTAFARGLPLLVHSDRNAVDVKPSRSRKKVLAWLFRHAAGFLAVGERNKEFYRQHGVPDAKMFFSPLAVDNDFYLREALRLAPQREALRKELGIAPGECAILFVGRFINVKGLPDLLTAFKGLADTRAHLVLVGEGPYSAQLKEYVAAHRTERVHFAGSKSYEEVPAYYALADVFVLPSHREAWAVVVNEAMNFALPVVASHQVGAAQDLVKEGVNGFRFEAGDIPALAALLRRLAEDPELRRRMGEASRSMIRDWNFDQATEGALAALRSLRLNRKTEI